MFDILNIKKCEKIVSKTILKNMSKTILNLLVLTEEQSKIQ